MLIQFKQPGDPKKYPNFPAEGVEGSFDYPISEDVNENIERFGAAVVNSYFKRGAVVVLQGVGRNALSEGDGDKMVATNISAEDLQAKADAYKLGESAGRQRKSKLDKTLDLIDEATSPEELKALAKRLKERSAALNG